VVQADEHHKHKEFRYCYISLNDVPPGSLLFDPTALDNRDRVYGNIIDESSSFVALYENGAVTVRQHGIVYTANERGTIGGSILIDSQEQAAVFRGDQVALIPPQPGEIRSFVTALNDADTALVTSLDALDQPTYLLYKRGRTTLLDFGLTVTRLLEFLHIHINNHGIISGTAIDLPGIGDRGFRFSTRTGETTQLDPLPTEPDAWALDMNNRGDVLGYSFVPGGIERVGVWDRHGGVQDLLCRGHPGISDHQQSLALQREQSDCRNVCVVPRLRKIQKQLSCAQAQRTVELGRSGGELAERGGLGFHSRPERSRQYDRFGFFGCIPPGTH
jgi:hypothetical protein